MQVNVDINIINGIMINVRKYSCYPGICTFRIKQRMGHTVKNE